MGSRFDDRTVGKLTSFALNAKDAEKKGKGGIVHVDIRLTEKNRVVKVTEFVHSYCKKFLTEMNLFKFYLLLSFIPFLAP